MTMEIERDEWMYVYADSAEQAREFFGVHPTATVKAYHGKDGLCWAVEVPQGADVAALKAGPPPVDDNYIVGDRVQVCQNSGPESGVQGVCIHKSAIPTAGNDDVAIRSVPSGRLLAVNRRQLHRI